MIRAKYDSHTLTGQFAQDDSHNNGEDSRISMDDSCKQAVLLCYILYFFRIKLNYLIYCNQNSSTTNITVQNNGNTKIYTCESETRAKYKLLGVNKKHDTIKISLDRLYNMYI